MSIGGSDVCGHRLFMWLKSSAMCLLQVVVSVLLSYGKKCHTYVVISENTLQEMLSSPHEFVSEAGTIVCFGG